MSGHWKVKEGVWYDLIYVYKRSLASEWRMNLREVRADMGRLGSRIFSWSRRKALWIISGWGTIFPVICILGYYQCVGTLLGFTCWFCIQQPCCSVLLTPKVCLKILMGFFFMLSVLQMRIFLLNLYFKNFLEFPGCPMVRTPRFHCWGCEFNLCSGN